MNKLINFQKKKAIKRIKTNDAELKKEETIKTKRKFSSLQSISILKAISSNLIST